MTSAMSPLKWTEARCPRPPDSEGAGDASVGVSLLSSSLAGSSSSSSFSGPSSPRPGSPGFAPSSWLSSDPGSSSLIFIGKSALGMASSSRSPSSYTTVYSPFFLLYFVIWPGYQFSSAKRTSTDLPSSFPPAASSAVTHPADTVGVCPTFSLVGYSGSGNLMDASSPSSYTTWYFRLRLSKLSSLPGNQSPPKLVSTSRPTSFPPAASFAEMAPSEGGASSSCGTPLFECSDRGVDRADPRPSSRGEDKEPSSSASPRFFFFFDFFFPPSVGSDGALLQASSSGSAATCFDFFFFFLSFFDFPSEAASLATSSSASTASSSGFFFFFFFFFLSSSCPDSAPLASASASPSSSLRFFFFFLLAFASPSFTSCSSLSSPSSASSSPASATVGVSGVSHSSLGLSAACSAGAASSASWSSLEESALAHASRLGAAPSGVSGRVSRSTWSDPISLSTPLPSVSFASHS
mmetsp:Transcript_4296/g.9226  ORF Transcript_4296/g.9226 Transcript_4296/m.9226 type:complete len:465 (-) Transcript_4296:1297-2691(-)